VTRWLAGLLALTACTRVAVRPSFEPLRMGGDLHQHVIMTDALGPSAGHPRNPLTGDPADRLGNQVTLEGLRRAGVRVVVATLWAGGATRELEEVRRQLRRLDALTDAQPAFAVVHSARDARRAIASGRIALVPGIEGAASIATVADVDALYAAGVRVVGLVHFFDNALAGAEDNQFGPLGLLTNGRDVGLTELGRAAVRRMAELGMVVDLAHASTRAARETLEVLEPLGVPAIASHVGPGFDAAHTLDDEVARRLARSGGLIGVGVFRSDVLHPLEPQERFAGFQPGTCDEVIAQWLHYAGLVGSDRVVLGTDFNSFIERARPGKVCPQGLANVGELPFLFEGLVKHGVPARSLHDSGERILELLEAVELKASATSMRLSR
jgi:membrane dipeptidase